MESMTDVSKWQAHRDLDTLVQAMEVIADHQRVVNMIKLAKLRFRDVINAAERGAAERGWQRVGSNQAEVTAKSKKGKR